MVGVKVGNILIRPRVNREGREDGREWCVYGEREKKKKKIKRERKKERKRICEQYLLR